MRTILTAAAAAALIASLASPAVAAPGAEADTPSSGSAPAPGTSPSTGSALKTNERNRPFDLQSHRGGRGQWTEESLGAFANSLKLGVSDVEYPYVGDRVAELSLAQVKTLDCGFAQLPGYPEQDVIEGNRIAELRDVFQLATDYNAKKVRFNVETKVEDGMPGGEGMAALTKAAVIEIYKAGMSQHTSVQSFDWSWLNLTRKIAPQLPLVALSSGDAWTQVGQPGASPNLGGIDIDTYGGSLARAAAAQGYDAVSPTFSSVTPEMIADAHQLGLPVIPWTVNTPNDMTRLMDLGVDGIITDYPTRLRRLMEQRGMKLPTAYAPAV